MVPIQAYTSFYTRIFPPLEVQLCKQGFSAASFLKVHLFGNLALPLHVMDMWLYTVAVTLDHVTINLLWFVH